MSCEFRGLLLGRCISPTSSEIYQSEVKVTEEIVVICHSKPASLSSTESSDGGNFNNNLLQLINGFGLFQIDIATICWLVSLLLVY